VPSAMSVPLAASTGGRGHGGRGQAFSFKARPDPWRIHRDSSGTKSAPARQQGHTCKEHELSSVVCKRKGVSALKRFMFVAFTEQNDRVVQTRVDALTGCSR
jgi:hypothetical protein